MAAAIFLSLGLARDSHFRVSILSFDALRHARSWRIPEGAVSHFYDITVYWGRQPYYDLEKVRSGFAWVPEWLQRNWKLKDQFERPFILAAVGTLFLAILAWEERNLRGALIRLLLMLRQSRSAW